MDAPALILRAAAAVGGQTALAAELRVSAAMVWQWGNGRRPVPIEYGAAIERATGGAVTRRDLWPDAWGDIWPELIDDAHPWPGASKEIQDAA